MAEPADDTTVTVASPVPPRKHKPTYEPGRHVGRYEIREALAEGGMGAVYAAYDPQLGRKIALKFVRVRGRNPSALRDARERLLREAQAIAQLSHPNVVAAHDVGTADGDVFIAMELVEGAHLRQWLEEKPRSFADKLSVMIDAGRGLAAAHWPALCGAAVRPRRRAARYARARLDDDARRRVRGDARARRAVRGAARSAHALSRSPARRAPRGHRRARRCGCKHGGSFRRCRARARATRRVCGSRLRALGIFGEIEAMLGTCDQALPQLARAQQIMEARSGKNHPNVAYPLLTTGRCLVDGGRPADAIARSSARSRSAPMPR